MTRDLLSSSLKMVSLICTRMNIRFYDYVNASFVAGNFENNIIQVLTIGFTERPQILRIKRFDAIASYKSTYSSNGKHCKI